MVFITVEPMKDEGGNDLDNRANSCSRVLAAEMLRMLGEYGLEHTTESIYVTLRSGGDYPEMAVKGGNEEEHAALDSLYAYLRKNPDELCGAQAE